MPGSPHEVLLVALREEPSLLGALVAKLRGASLPRGLKPVDSAVRFVKTAEVRPDLLFVRRRKRWVVVELQRRLDPAKRRRWPLAASLLLDQTGVLGDVIVITARRDVARWALRVAHLETPLGTKLALTPVVLHLGDAEAHALLDERQPELALFAAWAMHHRHGSKAKATVDRALDITSRLPTRLRRAQWRAIFSVLSERMRALYREASMNPDKIPESPGARKLRLFLEAQGYKRGEAKGRAEGEAKGRAEGEAKGEAKGRAEGEAKGAVKGKQDALLALLKARGLSVSTEERAALRACDDPAKLDKWIIRAASAESTGEVLGSRTRTRATRARNGVRKRAAARAS